MMPSLNRRVLSRWLLAVIVSLFAYSLAVPTASASVPPAGMMQWLSQLQCRVEITSSGISQSQVWHGDTFTLSVNILNKKSFDSQNDVMLLKVDSNDNFQLINNSLTPPSVNYLSSDPKWTFQTPAIANGDGITVTADFKVRDTAELNTTNLHLTVWNRDETSCTKDRADISVPVKPSIDIKTNLLPDNASKTEHDSIAYTINVRNKTASSDLSNIPLTVTLKAPVRMTAAKPEKTDASPPAASVDKSDDNQYYIVTWNVSYSDFKPDSVKSLQMKYLDLRAGNYNPKACANPKSPYNTHTINPEDDCNQVTLAVNSDIEVTKQFKTPHHAGDTLSAGETVGFQVSIKNTGSDVRRDLKLADAVFVQCNQKFPDSCPNNNGDIGAYDNSMVLQLSSTNNNPNVVGYAVSSGKLCWNIGRLNPGETVNLQVSGIVADRNALLKTIYPRYGTGQRRNQFGVVNDCSDSSFTRTAWVDFDYEYCGQPNCSDLHLKVEKSFDGDAPKSGDPAVLKKTLIQGEHQVFNVTATNTGNLPTYATQITDYVSDDASGHGDNDSVKASEHYIQWVDSSMVGLNWPYTNNGKKYYHSFTKDVDGSAGYLDAHQSVTLKPEVKIRCDTPPGPYLGNVTPFANTAIISADGYQSAAGSSDRSDRVELFIEPGINHLALESTFTPNQGRANDPVNLSINVSNLGSDVNVGLYDTVVFATIPSKLKIISSEGVIDQVAHTITWTIPYIGPGGQLDANKQLTAKLQVDPYPVNDTLTANITATADTAADDTTDCGHASTSTAFHTIGANITIQKLPISQQLDYDDPNNPPNVTFTFQVNNLDQSNALDRRATPLTLYDVLSDATDKRFVYKGGTVTCNVVAFDATNAPVACDNNDQQVNPTVTNNGESIAWQLKYIPPRSMVKYTVEVALQPNIAFDRCPKPLPNELNLTGDFERTSGPVTVNIYPRTCINGAIYAKRAAGDTNPGITISGDNVIIDPNSLLSSDGSISCNTVNCQQVPYQFGFYASGQESSSVGLNFGKFVSRMYSNIQRTEKQATTWTQPPVNNEVILRGQVNLYGDDGSEAQYPDGRVWKITDNKKLVIDTTGDVTIIGKGTFIATDLEIRGNGRILYQNPGSPDNTIGFIIRPVGSNGRGSIFVGKDVRAIVGAYYAPGTMNDQLYTGNDDVIGSIIFEGGSDTSLQPANGVFIARKVKLDRDKIGLVYDAILNSAAGAPPGFKFVQSPSDTEEGS